jgi:hypothetical protein
MEGNNMVYVPKGAVRRNSRLSLDENPSQEDELVEQINSGTVAKGAVKRRQSRAGAMRDPFYIPPELIPKGWSVEWKRLETLNKPDDDTGYMGGLYEQGWEPASPDVYRKMLSPGYKHETIVRKGMILMTRPIELTKEAKDEDLLIAREQIDSKMRVVMGETKSGQLQRKVTANSRTYEPLPVDN